MVDEPPEDGVQVLAFSPGYAVGDARRLAFRVARTGAMEGVESYVLVSELEDVAQPPSWALYWRDGRKQVITGSSIEQAFSRAGYGGGAIHALDFYERVVDGGRNWVWNSERREWKQA